MATHASAEVRRGQILGAALSCFGEKGFRGARIDDIAERAGLSKGAIYWHFASKEEIFGALFDAYESSIFEEWTGIADEDVLTALERSGRTVLDAMLANRQLIDLWTEFLRHDAIRERLAKVYVKSRKLLAQLVERGVSEGRLAPCDPVATAAAITALVEGLLLQALVDRSFDAPAAWPAAWRAMSSGLRA